MNSVIVLTLLACGGPVLGGHQGHEYNIPVHGYNPQLQLLGEHVDLPEIPSKIIRVTKTVAVHVPVPYPVKIKQNVPYPVHVSKPYPVPVPHIIRVPQAAPQPTKPVQEQVYEAYPPQSSYTPQQSQASFVPQQAAFLPQQAQGWIPSPQKDFQAGPEVQFQLQSSGDEGGIGGGYGSSFQGAIGPFHQEAASGGGQSYEGSDDGASYGGAQGGSSYGGVSSGPSYSGEQGGSSYGGDQGGSSYSAAGDSDSGHSPGDGRSYDSEYQSYDNAIQNYHQSHPQNSGYDSYAGSAGSDVSQGQQELQGHGGY